MLKVKALENKDYELIRAAEEVIERNYKYGRHHIGSAVRTTLGNVFSAVHVEANVGRITVCGEAMASESLYQKATMNLKRLWQSLIHTHMKILNNVGL